MNSKRIHRLSLCQRRRYLLYGLRADPDIGTWKHPDGVLQCAKAKLAEHTEFGHRDVVRVLKDHARLCKLLL